MSFWEALRKYFSMKSLVCHGKISSLHKKKKKRFSVKKNIQNFEGNFPLNKADCI